MEIALSSSPPRDATVAVLVTDPPGAGSGLDELIASGEVKADRGQARLVRLDGRRIVAAGAGPRADVGLDALRDAAAAAVGLLRTTVGGALAWPLDETLALPADEQAKAVVEGAVIGAYSPGRWKTVTRNDVELGMLTIVSDGDVEAAVRHAERVTRWVTYARDLVNRPPNDLDPARLADAASELADRLAGLSAESLGPAEMRERGMGALLGVGAGSANEPRLIVLRWQPPEPALDDLVLALVGKALTFDSGGLSLKPAQHMEDMKADMAGGAAVVAGIAAIAELGVPLTAIAVVASAENMPGASSMRPGDILTAANGKTIEVTNTDAEGRLVLADALVHARELGGTHLVDFATLTGAMTLALGDIYAGVFANDDAWREQVVAAGEASGDYVWPLPLHPRYRRLIDSEFADMKNSSLRRLGAPAYATSFLAEFAGEGPWAHVDMAGTGFLTWSRGDYLSQVGGTGFGVRLIVELAERLSEAR